MFHLTLFEKMIGEFVTENPDLIWFRIRAKVNAMFDKAYKIESSWMHYVLGHRFSREVTNATVAYFIKVRMKAIGMYDEHGDPYGFAERTPLVIALNQRKMANETRTNFFEGAVANYTKKDLHWEECDGTPIKYIEVAQPTFEQGVAEAKQKNRNKG